MQSVSVSVCRRCGVVAPAQGTACDVCRQPLAAVRAAAPATPPDQFWVAVRAGFTCNSCRFLAPLDSLDADGAVECAHCGLRQRFDNDNWRPALEFAHAVADLAGPAAEGRNPHPVIWIGSDNPHARVGDTRTFDDFDSGPLSFHAAPGHPVCQKCSTLVHVSASQGTCQSACPSCGDRATFRVADGARSLYPALLAVVSDDARSDRPKAQLSAPAGAAMTVNCCSCGAPLTLEGKGSLQTCKYCNTSCIVPHRSLSRALHEAIEPAIWWILLGGVSAKRSELLTEHAQKSGETHKSALALLKKATGGKHKIGDAPGVYEAPEVSGWNVPQMLFTVALGVVALLIAFGITRLVGVSF